MQFAAAKYYRLAEKNGNKTLGNSWYVTKTTSSAFPIGPRGFESGLSFHFPLRNARWSPTQICDVLLSGGSCGPSGQICRPAKASQPGLFACPKQQQLLLHTRTGCVSDDGLAIQVIGHLPPRAPFRLVASLSVSTGSRGSGWRSLRSFLSGSFGVVWSLVCSVPWLGFLTLSSCCASSSHPRCRYAQALGGALRITHSLADKTHVCTLTCNLCLGSGKKNTTQATRGRRARDRVSPAAAAVAPPKMGGVVGFPSPDFLRRLHSSKRIEKKPPSSSVLRGPPSVVKMLHSTLIVPLTAPPP